MDHAVLDRRTGFARYQIASACLLRTGWQSDGKQQHRVAQGVVRRKHRKGLHLGKKAINYQDTRGKTTKGMANSCEELVVSLKRRIVRNDLLLFVKDDFLHAAPEEIYRVSQKKRTFRIETASSAALAPVREAAHLLGDQ